VHFEWRGAGMGVKEWRGFRKHFFSSFLLIDHFGSSTCRMNLGVLRA